MDDLVEKQREAVEEKLDTLEDLIEEKETGLEDLPSPVAEYVQEALWWAEREIGFANADEPYRRLLEHLRENEQE